MKKSVRSRRHIQRFAVTPRLTLVGTEGAQSHTTVIDKVKNAWTLNRIPFIDRTEQDVVLEPMVKGLGCKLVSFGPLFVGYSWRMGIIKPRIGTCYPDGVIGTGPNFKSVIV